VADDVLSTDLPAIAATGSAESVTREATRDGTRHRQILRKPHKHANGLEATNGEEPQAELPEHEIDSFA
jgi:hypothetical protein